MYTNEEALKDSTNYFNGDELAASVFVGKYALRDEEGNLLESNPDQMHWRLAEEFARIEANYPNPMSKEEIYHLLKNFQYVVAQGSPMSAIGNPYQLQSASNCFVISGPTDAYSGILRTDQEQAQIMKRRGGVGFDISNIRPKGMKTKNAARTTDGIGVFMERFSNTCREVAQGGRRGALMLTISCHHPEIRTFINIKRNLKKVTGANISIRLTDEFMNAVKNGTTVELRWPVSDPNPKLREFVDAKALWDEIVDAAWTSAEPGLLFWDTCQRNTPSDIYRDFGYESLSTNPCLVGDTMVAVADGRGSVSFEDLVKEGKDVPVYCRADNGRVAVKVMRNPRITGYDKPVYEVTLDGGSTFKATENHRMLMRDGNYKEIKDMVPGDSLHVGFRYEGPIVNIPTQKSRSVRTMYWLLKNCDSRFSKTEHRYIYEHNFGEIENGYHIHHKDHNSKNNSIDNLEKISISDHEILHRDRMLGENNPIHHLKKDKERFEEYCKLQSDNNAGLGNPNCFEISNEDLKAKGIELTLSIGRRFSIQEWAKYAKYNSLPISFSDYRKKSLGDIKEFSKMCAKICNIPEEEFELDPRSIKTLQNVKNQGYEARLIDGIAWVKKCCEICGNTFEIPFGRREQSFCSQSCGTKYVNTDLTHALNRSNAINQASSLKMEKIKKKQMDLYCDFKYSLGRDPWLLEYKKECKKNGISCRFGTKYGFKDYEDLKINAAHNNHKIVKIEFVGNQTVYNGTVDDFHNFYICGKESVIDGKSEIVLLNSKNCGEIILSKGDSCRLMCLNLLGFVSNPFTTKAKFDYGKFAEYAIKAQRLMDDMIDIELEQIDKILSKIQSDPEDEETKFYEIKLWEGIRVACSNGRRTGLGITALGDTLAALGIQYGSKDSIEIAEKIYKTLAINSYKSSCIMAGERGTFPAFNSELEKGHQFLERILNSDNELRDLYEKHGRRNIANTTTAPTGSVSTMTQTTSGIEPAYLVFYKRRKKINPLDGNSRVDFVDDLGDKWQEYPVFHHGFKSWMDINGYTIDETNSNQKTAEDLEFYKNSPYYKATSNDIDWLASVEIQAAAQKWICHAISKTCNVPENCPKSTISEVYMKAWESGCKGFTVYRDKCRDGVLVSNDAKKSNFSKSTAPKRPKILDCEIHETKVSGEEFFVIIGILEGRPYEVFSGKGKISNRKHGKLIKIKRGHYDLETEDGIIRDISSKFTDEEVIIARLTSLSLRHGSDIKFIVDQIEKAPGDMHSFCKSIGRILKKYIPNGEKVTGASCETCGSSTLIREEGCMTCKSCGWSKCS